MLNAVTFAKVLTPSYQHQYLVLTLFLAVGKYQPYKSYCGLLHTVKMEAESPSESTATNCQAVRKLHIANTLRNCQAVHC